MKKVVYGFVIGVVFSCLFYCDNGGSSPMLLGVSAGSPASLCGGGTITSVEFYTIKEGSVTPDTKLNNGDTLPANHWVEVRLGPDALNCPVGHWLAKDGDGNEYASGGVEVYVMQSGVSTVNTIATVDARDDGGETVLEITPVHGGSWPSGITIIVTGTLVGKDGGVATIAPFQFKTP